MSDPSRPVHRALSLALALALALPLVAACDSASNPSDGAVDGAVDGARPPSADASTPARKRRQLVTAPSWRPLDAGSDPFGDRLDPVQCPPTAYMAENLVGESVFSVDTEFCNYITASQTSLFAVQAGDYFKLRIWHFELTAAEPAVAHVALRMGDSILYEEDVAIPADGELLSGVVRAEQDFPPETPVYFHLHNHGQNSWSMLELSAGPDDPDAPQAP